MTNPSPDFHLWFLAWSLVRMPDNCPHDPDSVIASKVSAFTNLKTNSPVLKCCLQKLITLHGPRLDKSPACCTLSITLYLHADRATAWRSRRRSLATVTVCKHITGHATTNYYATRGRAYFILNATALVPTVCLHANFGWLSDLGFVFLFLLLFPLPLSLSVALH